MLQLMDKLHWLSWKKISAQYFLVISLFTGFTFLFGNNAVAQEKDSITVLLNKNTFVQGDSIGFEVFLYNYATVAKTATVQLWIENVKTGRQWKYRYPVINGYLSAKLKVDSSLADGVYAFNFMLQKKFFNISGQVKNAGKKDNQVNYVMISKNKQTMLDMVALDDSKSFIIKNLLFQDSAFIIFSKPKHKQNDLLVEIKTPLDSAFVPSAVSSAIISIGNIDSAAQAAAVKASSYSFKPGNTQYKIILPEVVIKSRSNARLEQFDKETTTGAFTNSDAIVLDGISSNEIANAPDLFTYLTIKVGGLRMETDNQTGNRNFTWRGAETDIFLNEIRLDPDVPFWINPSDIAMIKIFRPGTSLTANGSPGGAIAIYTKTGQYKQETNRNYSFYILGYTGVESTWK
ncbi:MAG: hypothetical protein QM791_14375 [Ferruginibacter sp.]